MKLDVACRASRNRSFLCKQALAAVASCTAVLSTGLTLGISSVMLPQLREDQAFHNDAGQESWIASIATLSMIIGSLCCGPILDNCGRKITHILAGIPFTIGWVIIACASSSNTILIGRFITGISAGATKATSLVYIAEITDPKYRAAGLFLPGFIVTSGVLLSHLAGYYLGWKISSIIFIIPAVAPSIFFLYLHESPLWLIAKGKITEGVEIFRWFRGISEDSEAELASVLERQFEKPVMSIRETLNVACSKSFIVPMLVLMVVMIDVQLSGINVLSFYSQDIFQKAFSGSIDPFVLTVSMDCIRSLVCLLICLIGNIVPRKLTLLVSNLCVTVFNFSLVASFAIDFSDFVWLPVFCLVMFIVFSSVVLSTGWSFVSELLPTKARGLGSSLNSTFSFTSLFVSVNIIPDIMKAFGEIGLFAYFGTSTLICGTILSFVLPETNGKTLQSIEDRYGSKKCNKNLEK